MSSKVLLLLGLLAAVVLLFASEGAARDLAEKTSTDKKDGEITFKFLWQRIRELSNKKNSNFLIVDELLIIYIYIYL